MTPNAGKLDPREKGRISSFVDDRDGNVADRALEVLHSTQLHEANGRLFAFLFCVRPMTEYSVSSKVEAAINKQLANEEEGKA